MRIVYFARRFFEGWRLANPYISVFVIDPPIGPDPRGTGEPPQHVYRLGYPPAFPALCLYDPVEDDWKPSEFIVGRMIPWTIKWLFFHEEWVDSGVWKGGGRHPEVPEPCRKEEDLDPESRARLERFRNAAFHSLGRRIGVFGSCLLMEAASAGSSLPQYWQNWSGVTRRTFNRILLRSCRRDLDWGHHRRWLGRRLLGRRAASSAEERSFRPQAA